MTLFANEALHADRKVLDSSKKIYTTNTGDDSFIVIVQFVRIFIPAQEVCALICELQYCRWRW